MNDLNAQQIVLLCLLVSFVTAVATGITAVTLLDQAPQPVTQTINRIVERSVEKVIEPAENNNDQPVERIVETVVVNQEDLTVDAVAKNAPHLVRIYTLDRFENKNYAGLGVVVNPNGRVITDASITTAGGSFVIDYKEGSYAATIEQDTSGGVALLTPTDPQGTVFSAATLGDSQSVKLAQTVIAISGNGSNVVATGIITELTTAAGEVAAEDADADSKPVEALTAITTDIAAVSAAPGSMLITLKGDIVGLKVGPVVGGTYTPINALKGRINQ